MKKEIKMFIVLVSILSMGIVFVRRYDFKDKNDIAVFIDEEKSDKIPLKDTYVFDKAICDDDVLVSWNYKTWGLNINNLKKKVKCNLYFISDPIGNKIKASLDTTGKCPAVNSDGTVNVTGAESENSLLCSAPDNYGTSYYYRGNVQNNYVYFAGYYWRIVRINGDNSVRIIYDGKNVHQNGENSDDRIIGTSAFNEKSDDNAYVGYMYGTPNSSTYEETHANINDSTIKKYVDNWYENNIKDTDYEEYLADNIFCNNRNISNYNPSNLSNLGYGKNNTVYERAFGPWSAPSDTNNARMTYLCKKINDSFTKNSVIGNTSLKYAVSLLSKDELVLSGQYSFGNGTIRNYLYVGNSYWLISPDAYDNDGPKVRLMKNEGEQYEPVNKFAGVKPVINLKAGSLKMGDGSSTNPYRIS